MSHELLPRIAELEHVIWMQRNECGLLNTSLTQAEAKLAERDRRLEGFRLSIVRRKQEAALYGDNAEWEGLAIALGIFDDWRAGE